MGFSKKIKIGLVVTAMATTAAVSSLVGCRQDSPDYTPPPNAAEDTIAPSSTATDDTTTTLQEESATLEWPRRNILRYQYGDTSWETNVAEGIEEAVSKMTAEPSLANVSASDFYRIGALVVCPPKRSPVLMLDWN